LSLDSATGVISGTPTAVGNYVFSISASNSAGTDTDQLTLLVTPAPVAPVITSNVPTSGTATTPYSFQVTASGYPAPTFTVSDGALPVGLSLDSATGVISGTPTTAGDSVFMITASNAVNPNSTEMYSVTIAPQSYERQAPLITSGAATDGVVDTEYEFLVTASGSPAPIFAVVGSLPAGLSLDSATGVISGTPTAAGTYVFSISASNSAGTDTDQLTLMVAATAVAPVITSSFSMDGVAGTWYSFQVEATGFPAPTFGLVGSLPAGLSLDSVTGVISGTPTAAASYIFWISANNSAGTDMSDALRVMVAPTPVAPVIISGDVGRLSIGTATAELYPELTMIPERRVAFWIPSVLIANTVLMLFSVQELSPHKIHRCEWTVVRLSRMPTVARMSSPRQSGYWVRCNCGRY
jgi:hypothetical protein